MQLPISVSLQPSRRLAVLLLAAHGGAAFALTAMASHGLGTWPTLALLLLVSLSFVWQLARLSGARRFVRLTLHKDGTLEYWRYDGETAACRVDAQSAVTPWLTVLLLRNATRSGIALILLPDSLADEDFRRLRLWLRWVAARDAGGMSP